MDGYLEAESISNRPEWWIPYRRYMDVSENSGTPKSSILIGFSIINHPFWGTPIFGNTHVQALPFKQAKGVVDA